MSKCPRPIQKCEPQVLPSTAEVCPDWSVCLPWGGRLYQTEGCVRYEPGTPPPDGVYGLFTLKDGCFIKAEEHPSDVYHPDPCAPVPCPCDSEGEGSGNLCNPYRQRHQYQPLQALGQSRRRRRDLHHLRL